MKFIFLAIPAHGHVNPMLGIVKQLTQDGHKVIFYNTEKFRKVIERSGAEFRTPPINIQDVDLRIAKNILKVSELVIKITEQIVPTLIDVINEEKPDCLVYDSMTLWGRVVGGHISAKRVAILTTFALNTKVIIGGTKYMIPDYLYMISQPLKTIKVIGGLRTLAKKYHFSPSLMNLFINTEELNIVFTSGYFQVYRGSFDDSFKFVGPSIYNRKGEPLAPKLLQTKRPIIYVALGTIYNDNPEIYRSIIQSLKKTPYQVFISLGTHISIKDLGEIPDNMYIRNYLPQLEILSKSSLFISHGGMNSINESLYYGVPLLLLPIIHEQKLNARRVEELGAGIYYKKNQINPIKFTELIEKILHDSSYKNNAKIIGKSLVQAGGYKKATKYIYDYLKA